MERKKNWGGYKKLVNDTHKYRVCSSVVSVRTFL